MPSSGSSGTVRGLRVKSPIQRKRRLRNVKHLFATTVLKETCYNELTLFGEGFKRVACLFAVRMSNMGPVTGGALKHLIDITPLLRTTYDALKVSTMIILSSFANICNLRTRSQTQTWVKEMKLGFITCFVLCLSIERILLDSHPIFDLENSL
ncbi:putative transcription associated protein motif protein [Ranid herpesvirus 3]|uniref:Putative transcription associated protein motif protein n=1 Tax=Ranid herpesvirus 3 TaxID=1987509 RepID=A0A1X9T5J8_9VIRU|nr:putative transcription associated protein motif protein [Ranid herpesvirus 3]ARR28976.1 putative transcription associated protein motif protein [Ranid herpesvirus 3]